MQQLLFSSFHIGHRLKSTNVVSQSPIQLNHEQNHSICWLLGLPQLTEIHIPANCSTFRPLIFGVFDFSAINQLISNISQLVNPDYDILRSSSPLPILSSTFIPIDTGHLILMLLEPYQCSSTTSQSLLPSSLTSFRCTRAHSSSTCHP